jgi:hypothetical protein
MSLRMYGIDRVLAKVDIGNSPAGCWIWTAHTNPKGYGQVWFNGAARLSHKVVYEELVGVIPDGHTLDHQCRDRACCNPLHLEAIPHGDNVRRGNAGRYVRTHCVNGHPYAGDNFKVRVDGTRRCLICQRACNRARRRAMV